MKRSAAGLGLSSILLALSLVAPALATTYYGPQFSVTPASVAPGGTITITLTTGSASYFVPPPSGSSISCQAGQTCVFPLQSCTNASAFYYSIHQITVTDNNGTGNNYMLGSATESGMAWPVVLGGPSGQYTGAGFADALNVTIGDTFSLLFGPSQGGFTYSSLLGNPPNTHSPAGPYYWWTTSNNNVPNVWGNNLRLDKNPQINPTGGQGPYIVDIEGVVLCGRGVFFDQSVKIFFDQSTRVPVPEFPGLGAIAIAVSFAGLALMKRKLPSA